ncbi:signal-transducing adaptor protein 1-like isoform X2 [Petromyzon marinus]|uniref:signal-transducing adaptor protein 1-like isoform X2 n=1 Tax=Petromyzon marinus TaxID=7757 RepID=UPI003F6F1BC0
MDFRVQRERDIAIMRDQKTMVPVYMRGFLEKKSSTDKALKTCWVELRGNILFFYSTDRDIEYTEKIPLAKPLVFHMDSSMMRGTSSCKMKLKTSTIELKLKADTETIEMWKAYILAVTEYIIPRDITLLPGQMQRLREIIEREKERQGWPEPNECPMPPQPPTHRILHPDALQIPRASVLTPATAQGPAPVLHNNTLSFPSCYYDVSRETAEQMLQEHPDWGNLLLRPGSNRTDYAVSVWNDHPSYRTGAILHYRISVKGNLYVIELTNKMEVRSLHEVSDHFVKATNGTLRPFIIPDPATENYGIYTDTAPNVTSAADGRTARCSTSLPDGSSAAPAMPAASVKGSTSTHHPISQKSSTSSGNSSTTGAELDEELKSAVLRRRKYIGEDMIYIESK